VCNSTEKNEPASLNLILKKLRGGAGGTKRNGLGPAATGIRFGLMSGRSRICSSGGMESNGGRPSTASRKGTRRDSPSDGKLSTAARLNERSPGRRLTGRDSTAARLNLGDWPNVRSRAEFSTAQSRYPTSKQVGANNFIPVRCVLLQN
jgi:hypothetical protein